MWALIQKNIKSYPLLLDTKYINPFLLEYPWTSGDNYEEFYDHYFNINNKKAHWEDPEFLDYVTNIGKFIGNFIPIADIILPSWVDSTDLEKGIALTKFTEEYTFGKVGNEVIEKFPYEKDYIEYLYYKVLMSLPTDLCKTLAPNLNHPCHEVSLLLIDRFITRGCIDEFSIFGLFDVNGKH